MSTEGWKYVPIEPTEEMLDASWLLSGESYAMRDQYTSRQAKHYAAMLAASPSPAASPDETLLVRARKAITKHINFSVFADENKQASPLAEDTARKLTAEVAALAMAYHIERLAADASQALSARRDTGEEAERRIIVELERMREAAAALVERRGSYGDDNLAAEIRALSPASAEPMKDEKETEHG